MSQFRELHFRDVTGSILKRVKARLSHEFRNLNDTIKTDRLSIAFLIRVI